MMKTRLVVLVSILVVVAAYGGNSRAVAKTYYVSTSGDDSASGLAEKTAFRTITHAATRAQAGDTVYIKGGKYDNERVVISNSGTAEKPIVFQGYEKTPGDTPAPENMPLLNGSTKKTTGVLLDGKSYITIDSIALTRYGWGIYGLDSGTHHIKLSNIIVYGNTDGIGFGSTEEKTGPHNVVIRNCTAHDNDICSFELSKTSESLIEDCKAWNASWGYAVKYGSRNNIIKNCIAGGSGSRYYWCISGYVFIFNASHNRVVDCKSFNTIYNHFQVLQDSDYNEFVNCVGVGVCSNKIPLFYYDRGSICHRAGFTIGSSHTKVTNCVVRNVVRGIYVCMTRWSPSGSSITGNVFKNNIVANNEVGIYFRSAIKDNVIEYNDVWGNKKNYKNCSAGTGDISLDPLFADAVNYDFHLKSRYGRWDGKKWVKDKATSPCIDAGDPKSKWKNEPAPNGGRVNIGAYGNTPKASKSASATPARKGR